MAVGCMEYVKTENPPPHRLRLPPYVIYIYIDLASGIQHRFLESECASRKRFILSLYLYMLMAHEMGNSN